MLEQITVRPSCLFLLVALLSLAPAQVSAVAAQDTLSGVWSGQFEAMGTAYEIRVVLQATNDGGWTGLIDIPTQNVTGYPLTEITASGSEVSFAMAGAPGDPTFVGTWDPEASTISGNLRQMGQAFPFNLSRTGDAPEVSVEAVASEDAARASGSWSGSMSTGGQTLRVVFHIAAADGGLSATMDSPDQGQAGLPINRVSFDGSTLRLELDYAGAAFEGTMSDDGTTVAGNWTQGGASLPLTVTKQ